MASKYPNSGTLGKNEKQRPDSKDPNLSGQAEIDGVEYWLSGWTKTGRDGSKFISIAFKPKQAAQSTQRRDPPPSDDQDIPF